MYKWLKNSGSNYREIIGTEFYDNHWNDYIESISSSVPVFSSSAQITFAEQWMTASGSQFYSQYQGSE